MHRGRWGAVPWIVGCVALLLACTSLATAKVDEARIRALIANMTVLEKTRQLDLYHGGDIVSDGRVDPDTLALAWKGGVGGAVHDFYSRSAKEVNYIQQWVKQNSRLGIPVLFIEECLHGLEQAGHTVFPQAVALGASWDTDMVHRVGKAIGAEARAYGIGMCLSPVLGVGYEPRWGRIEELYGEDTYLVTRMGVAMVSGMQGGTDPHTSLATNHSVIAEPKHYGGHSWPESGLNTAPAHMGRRDLETIFLPTFKAAIMEAGARSVMAAYNEIDGIPNANNEDLLYEHLRNQWGFDGFVLSDEGAVSQLWTNHHTAASPLDAIVQFLTAGGNMQFYDFPHIIWDLFIAEAVESGQLSEAILDDRVADLLRVKMMLGLFDNPFTDPSLVPLVVNSQEHQDLALEAARKAIVLLKNDNSVLPLASAKLGSIALIGPSADMTQLGDYSGFGVLDNFITVLDGVSAKAPQAKIYHAWGSGVLHNDEMQVIRPRYLFPPNSTRTKSLPSSSAFATSLPKLLGGSGPNGGVPKNGLLGEYFDNPSFSGPPKVTQVDLQINFQWFLWPPFPDMPQLFSARWTGVLVPDVTVNSTIGVDYDFGGARLKVNGQVLVDTFASSNAPKTAPFSYQAGQEYEIELEFLRDYYCNYLELQWNLIGDPTAARDLAIAAATAADVVVVVVGENIFTCGEQYDRPTLDLPGSQQQLIETVRAAAPNKPFIAVLLHGRPLSVNWLNDNADAIITGFYPGQAQGRAIADVLFGDYNPAGRLPVTFPRGVGQLPMFYNYKPSARKNQTAIYADGTDSSPLYHFGHGLSYTKFTYSNLRIGPEVILPSSVVSVSVDLANVGEVAGDEVVQLYVRDEVSSVTTPVQSLKGFQRVPLQPKQSVTVTFALNVTKDLAVYNRKYEWVVEPGEFTVMVGSSSNNILLQGSFSVIL